MAVETAGQTAAAASSRLAARAPAAAAAELVVPAAASLQLRAVSDGRVSLVVKSGQKTSYMLCHEAWMLWMLGD